VRKLPTYIELEDYKKLIKATKQIKFKIAFMFGFESGLRLSEVVGLEKGERIIKPIHADRINFKDRKMMIESGKGGVDRVVPLPKGFKESHIKYLPLNKTYKNVASARRAIQKAFKGACKRANLLEKKPGLHFHSLRHGFASRLSGKGMPITFLRDLLGHSNISTTNIYSHTNPKERLEKYEELF